MPIPALSARDDSSDSCVGESTESQPPVCAAPPSNETSPAAALPAAASPPSASQTLSSKFSPAPTWQNLPVVSGSVASLDGCGVVQDCAAADGSAVQPGPQANVPQARFSVTVRRFAPFESFGGKFEGDARSRHIPASSEGTGGFTTDASATARTAMTVRVEGEAIANPTGHADLSRNPWLGEGRAVVHTSSTSSAASARDGQINAQSAGANPLIPALYSPVLDTALDLTYQLQPHALEVAGSVTGDAFPNAELFLSDREQTSVMLGTFQTTQGALEGPSRLGLRGTAELIQFHAEIPLDPSGNFAGSPVVHVQ
jgi:hypothetical protein